MKEAHQDGRPTLSKPDLALRLGVVGNRKFGDDLEKGLGDPANLGKSVASAIREVMGFFDGDLAALCDDERIKGWYSGAPPLIKVITSLAEGSDQIGARAALELAARQGSACQFELHAILPFPKQQYPNDHDFTPDAKRAFDELASAAAQIVRLDGEYRISDDRGEEVANRSKRVRAYQASAAYLLEQSDIIIAVWDRGAVGKSGGTEETVRKALQAGIPVIAIQPGASPTIRLILRCKDLDAPGAGIEWECALAERIAHLVCFPELYNKDSRSPFKSQKEEEANCQRAKDCLEEYYSPGKNSSASRFRIWLWQGFVNIFAGTPETLEEISEQKPKISPYAQYRDRAAELSRAHGGSYRGAFLLSYLLAILAVGLALAGIIAFHFQEIRSLTPLIGIICGTMELITIGFLILNLWTAKRHQWREKAADFRFLSEMLRPMNYLAPLAMTTPNSRLPAHYAAFDPRSSWTNWLFRALVRSQPMVLIEGEESPRDYQFTWESIKEGALRKVTKEWLPEQINYHRVNELKNYRMFHGIERLNGIFLWSVVVAVGAHLLIDIAHLKCLHSLSVPLLFTAAFLPATAAILTGLLYQADMRRQYERSRVMAHQLKENVLAELEKPRPHHLGCTCWQVGSEIRDEVAAKMIEEVADWQLLYRMDEVKAV